MSGGMEDCAMEEKQLEIAITPGETLLHVIENLKRREQLGIRKYNKVLNRKTDEDMLQHLYEELLDAAMYVQTLILQRKRT